MNKSQISTTENNTDIVMSIKKIMKNSSEEGELG